MEKVAAFIVDKRAVFISLFAALTVFSVFSSGWVKVENNIILYLSEDTETRQGLDLMQEEFVTYGTAQVMVNSISADDATTLAEKLEAVEGVTSAGFDAGSEKSYKDSKALFSLTFAYDQSDERCVAALDEAKQTLDSYDYVVDTEVGMDLSGMVAKEMQLIVIIVALVVVGVLIFTSGTFAEVPVLLITFLAAAIINKGTNFLFGTISFVSNSVTIVLQLALSVDYAIILCNRYKEEHRLKPVREAAISALSKAIPEISASSLTTIAGLTAMTFMQFRLGLDMGLVLIKAIVCSLFSVFLLMPGLLVLFGGLMDKTRHKKFVPQVPFIGKYAFATRYIIPPVFLLGVLAAMLIFQNCNYVFGEGTLHTVKQNERQIAQRSIVETFGEDNLMCAIVPAGDYATEQELLAELQEYPEVKSVLGLASAEAVDGFCLGDSVNAKQFSSIAGTDMTTAEALFAYYGASHSDYNAVSNDLTGYSVPLVDLFLFMHDEAEKGTFELSEEQTQMINGLYDKLYTARLQLQSDKYSRILVYLDLPEEGDETFAFIDKMHDIVGRYYDDYFVIGDSGSRNELAKPYAQDNTTVGLLSIVFVLIILLFTFRSIALPILLIMVIQGSIWINFALPTAMGTNVFFMCYLIVSAIQMGANIDYAIVISSRYLECRKTLEPRSAVIETMNLAFPTIITSGSMMSIAGLLIGSMSSEPVIAGIGKYVGTGTVISVILVMFVLPQLLIFGDALITATTIRIKRRSNNIEKTALTATCALLAAASVFALVALPLGLSKIADIRESNEARTHTILSQIKDIEDKLQELDAGKEIYDESKMDFSKGVVTDVVGSAQLAQGQAQYNAGAAQLADGQAQYDAAAGKLADAEQQYIAGQEKLNQGRADYNAGKAQLDDAKQQYAAGQAKLAEVQPIYNAVLPLYNSYLSLLDDYNNASTALKVILWPQVTAAKALFTTQLSGTGYSIESLISEYNAGQAQLADAAVQITNGQAQLDAAQKQIEDGQAQLDAAAVQLEAGKAQLAEAKAQLDAGYADLDNAAGQLNNGRQTLAANENTIEQSLEALTEYDDAKQYVEAGAAVLMENDVIADKVGSDATYGEICDAARKYLVDNSQTAKAELYQRTVIYWLIIAGAVIALAASILGLVLSASGKGSVLAAIICSSAATVTGFAAAIFGRARYTCVMPDGSGTGILQYASALAVMAAGIMLTSVLFYIFRRLRASSADSQN